MALPAILARTALLGGGLVGGALRGAGSAIGGIAAGAGSAVGGIAQGVGSAVGGALTPAPKVIVNNVGIAGTAGKKKVSGRGTLPAPKKTAKPTVNANMPTEKLLVVAVNYLSSIEKTLQDQLKFEGLAYQQQQQAEREAAVEKESGPGVFSKLGEKFGALKEYGGDVKKRGLDLGKLLLGGLGLAGLATLGISQLDTSELDRLKDNWDAFKEKFGWLGDIAATFTGPGGIVGYLLGGFRGAIIGAVGEWILERLTGQGIIGNLFGGEGSPTDAAMTGGAGDTLMTAGIAGYAGYRGVRTVRDIRARRATINQIRTAPRADPRLRSGFRDPVTGRAASRQAAAAGGGWLSGPKGQRFVAFLGRRFGQSYVAKKIMPLLSRVMVGLAVTATGVGAIPGLLWTLLNVGLGLYTVYELLDAWWDFQDEEEAREDAEAVNSSAPERQDATSTAAPALASNRVVNRSETGRPEEAQAFFESKGWTQAQAAGIVGNLVVESGLRTDAIGDGGRAYGIAQWHPDRQARFKEVYGKDIRNSNFQEQLEFVNWELNNSEKSAGDRLRNASDAGTAASIVDQYYERSAGIHREQRVANATAIAGGNYANLQGGGGGGSASGLLGSAMDIGGGAIKAIGNIMSAGLGPQSTRSTSASLNQSIAGAGNAANISAMSSAIQSQMDFGLDSNQDTAAVNQIIDAAQQSVQRASPDGRLAAIDPNYPGTGGVEGYLQYYRLAA